MVINDFGDINVDAGLVSGQIDEPASIAGGCICCLPDDGERDVALAMLADPQLRLDATVVEASGLADPVSIARIVGFSGVDGVRDGGVIDVIDAAAHFDTVDLGGTAPARYGAATLVVVNKLDQVPVEDGDARVHRVEHRVHERNSRAHIVGAINGRIDPALLFDVAAARDEVGQLSFRDLLLATDATDEHDHVQADSVTFTSAGSIDPDAVLDLLEDPPAGVYRLKGTVTVRHRSASRGYVVNVVGHSVHIMRASSRVPANCLVAIGLHVDIDDVRSRFADVLSPVATSPSAAATRRLQRRVNGSG